MSRRALAFLVGAGFVVAIAVAAITVWLLPTSTDAPTLGGTDAGLDIDPVGADPSDVAVMSGVFSWQPSVQDSPWDALHSQQKLLTGAVATAAAQRPVPAPKPLPEWAAWSRSGDTITAVVKTSGDPTVAGSSASVPVTIAQIVQHTTGDATPYTTTHATVTLKDGSNGWKVANYRLGQNAG